MSDTFTFWGIAQSAGEVTPANLDYPIYYTEDSVQNNLEGLVGTEIRVNHIQGDAVGIGEVIDYALLQDNLFVLNQIHRNKFEQFVESFDDENSYIRITFNQLTREINAGNLALSAGLKNASVAPTSVHQKTVMAYQWNEVSIVPAPASPGAWAWGCDDQCKTIFNVDMTNKDVELEGSDPEEGDIEQEAEVHNEPQAPDTIEMGGDKFKLVPAEQEADCNCETTELEQKVSNLKDELNTVKDKKEQLDTLVQKFKDQKRDEASSRLEELNQELPEDKAYSEDELTQMCEEAEISHLEQQVDLMERLAPVATTTDVEQGEEDLSGTSGSDNQDETKEKINQTAKELFGKDYETLMADIEE